MNMLTLHFLPHRFPVLTGAVFLLGLLLGYSSDAHAFTTDEVLVVCKNHDGADGKQCAACWGAPQVVQLNYAKNCEPGATSMCASHGGIDHPVIKIGSYDADFTCASPTSGVDGACGSANGKTYGSAPHTESVLCAQGAPSAVSDGSSGKWTWSCLGMNGGAKADCAANNCAQFHSCPSDYTQYYNCSGSSLGYHEFTTSSPPTSDDLATADQFCASKGATCCQAVTETRDRSTGAAQLDVTATNGTAVYIGNVDSNNGVRSRAHCMTSPPTPTGIWEHCGGFLNCSNSSCAYGCATGADPATDLQGSGAPTPATGCKIGTFYDWWAANGSGSAGAGTWRCEPIEGTWQQCGTLNTNTLVGTGCATADTIRTMANAATAGAACGPLGNYGYMTGSGVIPVFKCLK